MCFGTCRWFHQLNFFAQQLLTKPFRKKDQDVLALLLIGLYQLREMRIPDHAAINETVSATAELKKPWARALVNAVLRNYQRQEADLNESLEAAEATAQYSHPAWLLDALRSAWPEQCRDILSANNERPPLTLRVNLARRSREEYLQKLAQENIEARPGLLANSAIYLSKPKPVTDIPGFVDGVVSVQDEASQLVPQQLDLREGQRVLDACAAPGGKTCHILESERSLTSITALDKDERRLAGIRENLDRLDLKANILCADAADLENWWDGNPFDRILLDAPCSATGVIRRHPDIKLLRSPEEVADLISQQQRLLESLWQCLKADGLLLYTSCSILPEENQNQIAQFLSKHDDAKYEGITADWGVKCETGRQLLPSTASGTDGFFFSLLRKC